MSIFHLRSTTKGPGPVNIALSTESTQCNWKIRQVLLHCAATFTAICTVSIKSICHEGTAYDSVFHSGTVATADGVLQDFAWVPDTPYSMCGKDRIAITFGSASAAMAWGYDICVEA